METISVVVPIYNEAEVIGEFYRRLESVMDSMGQFDYEIILVDDGSEDGTYDKLIEIAQDNQRVDVIRLSRNFGHQAAITAGVDSAIGNAVVVIDADLQDPPEVIKRFIERWQEGFDVVYGVRKKRLGESKMKIWTANLFYKTLRLFTDIDVPVNVGDFRLMSRRVVERLQALREKDRFVRGLVSWIGFRQAGVEYKRDKRYAGETKYPYRKLVKLAIDGVTSFSTVPLKISTWLGYVSSMLSFLYLCNVLVQKYLGNTVKGWASIMVVMTFLGGVQLICMGIIGEYIGRLLKEVKPRPIYIKDKKRSIENQSTKISKNDCESGNPNTSDLRGKGEM
jgi:dolichol-phosphate mannosyltransferase